MKHLVGIGVVWLGCTFCWMVLGTSLTVRTDESWSSNSHELEGLWGPEATQRFPTAHRSDETGQALTSETSRAFPAVAAETSVPRSDLVRLVGTQVSVELDLEHRKKGLQWFPAYELSFLGDYEWLHEAPDRGTVQFEFPLTQAGDSFDGFAVTRDGEPVRVETRDGVARWSAEVEGAESLRFRVAYRSRGVTSWTYQLMTGTSEVENFRLAMHVNDSDIDFGTGSLSPTNHGEVAGGWEGEWRFDHLISNDAIHVVMPQRLNPGPLAGKITFFAPLSLLFFFFVVALVARARFRELHPMHFFFFGCSFFAFHLLFGYLVDHVPVIPSFGIASLVSLFLTVSYARHFVGLRFAIRVMGGAQFLYLVLFSASFFLEGFTGLTVTIGAIATLFVMMQLTGNTTWGKKEEAEPRSKAPLPVHTASPGDDDGRAPITF
ncbi:MAG: hypothetical protein ACI9KE_002467 [Polyangiales bacterium]|jgi:hypothetical protein